MAPAGFCLQTFFSSSAETGQCEAARDKTVDINQREM